MKYEKPTKRVDPADHGLPANIPNGMEVPPWNIVVLTEDNALDHLPRQLMTSLGGERKRDWFAAHAYHCLPLVMANQTGFVVKALYAFEVEWNGGPNPDDVIVTPILTEEDRFSHAEGCQFISSHFGMGTFTIQNRWQLRSPPGINLMTIAPPNMLKDGVCHMSGMVEADNLRRDFTFNLRMTRENHKVRFEKGEVVGCILPYPRNFFDTFEVSMADQLFSKEVIEGERAAARLAGIERQEIDTQFSGGNGRRYMEGEDVFGNQFEDHQKRSRPPQESFQRFMASAARNGLAGQPPADTDDSSKPVTSVEEVLFIPNALSADGCEFLCWAFEELKHLTKNGDPNSRFFDDRVVHFRDIAENMGLAASMMKLVTDMARHSIARHFKVEDVWADDIQLVKWWAGHTMDVHADKENPDGSPHQSPTRDFASVLYLNDAYEGGEVFFPNQDLVVSPQVGDIVIFRGDLLHAHGVKEVISGQRYTLPTWYSTHPEAANPEIYPEMYDD